MSLSYSLPTVGQPDSTEDPKIVTALSSVLSWSDGVTKLKPTLQTGGTYTASDGDLVETGAAGAATHTLPDVTAARVVGWTNFSGNAVTVQRAGGATINGPGLGGATSFSLSQPGAFIILVSDLANWFVVAGGQDTGWVALTLAAGITTGGGYTPSARLRGDTVTLKGGIQNPTGSPINNAFTVPAGLRPSANVFPSGAQFYIATTGVANLSVAAGLTYGVDGLSYPTA